MLALHVRLAVVDVTKPNATQREFVSDRSNRDVERARRNRSEKAREKDALEAMRQHQRDLKAAFYRRRADALKQTGEAT